MDNTTGNSHVITSTQVCIHESLIDSVSDYPTELYRRPIAQYSKDTFDTIMTWIEENQTSEQRIILDMCCGIGESSFHLASKYPDSLIIGIDKSVSRLERKNKFKEELPQNVLLMRGELLDLWFLFAQAVQEGKVSFYKQYILYPNPYPKKHHYKKRWHGNPIAPFIFQTCPNIEVRSNWKIYMDEFKAVSEYFNAGLGSVYKFEPNTFITPFEKKYSLSGQALYGLQRN